MLDLDHGTYPYDTDYNLIYNQMNLKLNLTYMIFK